MVTTLDTDAAQPAVRLLTHITPYTGVLLDKDLSNWIPWSNAMYKSMVLSGLLSYTKDTSLARRPDVTTQPRAHANWNENDERACGFIYGALSDNEVRALGTPPQTDAHAFWTLLETRHKSDGPIAQVFLIKEAWQVTAVDDEPFTKGIDRIFDLLDHAYAIGDVTLETFKSILVLNFFGRHQDLQFALQDRIKLSTKSSPFTPSDIREFAADKYRLISATKKEQAALVLSAQAASTSHGKKKGESRGERPTYYCSTCKKETSHISRYCIRAGGGMAGKTIEESKAQKRADFAAEKEGKNSGGAKNNGGAQANSNRIAVARTDSATGRAYLSYVDPAHLHASADEDFAGFVEHGLPSINTDVDILDEDEDESFMALNQPITDAFLSGPLDLVPEYKLLSPQLAEPPAWMTMDGEITTSVNWNHQRQNIDIANISATALAQNTRTTARAADFPFYLDTGATTHISPSSEDFLTLRPITSRSVKGVGGTSIFATGIGNIKLRIARGAWLMLRDVLFIPAATVRLISVSSIARDSKVVSHFDDSSCWITSKSSGALIARGELLPSMRLYTLELHSPTADHALAVTHAPDLETWHRRLGHVGYQSLQDMARKGMVEGMSTSLSNAKAPKCESCILGKQTKTSVPKKRIEGEGHRATRVLEKVWVDLTGPEDTVSKTGNKYIMNLVDDHSNFPWTIPLKDKAQAFPELQKWQKQVELETGFTIGIFITDRGELKSDQMEGWLATRGTVQLFTAPYTSAHIGRVERMHRTLMGKARAMRIYAKCPPNLWDEFYLTASHIHTKTPTRSLGGLTPYEIFKKRKPDYSYMREIGCQVFVLILNKNNPKLYERSIECVLIGYDFNSKAYRCYDRATRRVYSSYHVRFIESHESPSPPSTQPLPLINPPTPTTLNEIIQGATSTPIYFDDDAEEDQLPRNHTSPIPDQIPVPLNPAPINSIADTATKTDQPQHPDQDQAVPRRSTRIAEHGGPVAPGSTMERVRKEVAASKAVKDAQRDEKKRKKLQDIREEELRNDPVILDEAAKQNLCEIGENIEGIRVTDTQLAEISQVFEHLAIDDRDQGAAAERVDRILAAIAEHSNIDPRTFGFDEEPKDWADAQLRPPAEAAEWKAAFEDESKSLKDMGVYKLVPRTEVPDTHKIRHCKPVLKNKLDENGNLSRRKVRFVFKGYEQQYGRDYTSTTSPTARMESWRILLHLAGALGWDAQQIDIKTAFLYGLLPDNEVQYMEQPKGFEEPGKETWVWKLQRGLYGMKQAGRIWNRTMNEAMISWGFMRLSCESCIYYRKSNTGIVIAAVHVDDFLSVGDSRAENEKFKMQMKTLWTISDLGDVKFCVGIAVSRDRDARTISLSQTALIDKIISQFGQHDAFPVNTPMDPGLKLRRPDRTKFSSQDIRQLEKLPYRSLVGCLIYLSVATRPDITYAVQQLSQFLDSFSFVHWNAAIRVVRYLKGTRNLKLTLGGRNAISLLGFTDSDWANCLDTRRSIGGYGFSLGSGLISWTAKKQKTVASSSCEAEYTAAFEAAKEAIWLRTLLSSIDFDQGRASTILCDNNAAINLSEDPSLHQRVKHVDIKYHFLRERVQSSDLRLSYINTHDNLADIFTKALDHTKFKRLRGLLGMI